MTGHTLLCRSRDYHRDAGAVHLLLLMEVHAEQELLHIKVSYLDRGHNRLFTDVLYFYIDLFLLLYAGDCSLYLRPLRVLFAMLC